MIHEKAFHLKIRKGGVRWGCHCCSGPIGRDAVKKRQRTWIKVRWVDRGKVAEKKLFADLVWKYLQGFE